MQHSLSLEEIDVLSDKTEYFSGNYCNINLLILILLN